MRQYPGLFITLSGGEGSGKSTIARSIADTIEQLYDLQVYLTKQPGGTPFGANLREILLHGKYPLSVHEELYLFCADRAHHAPVIEQELMANKLVICDRFADDTVVYQGYARGLDLDLVRQNAWKAARNVSPDHSFFLMVDPETGLRRVSSRPDPNTRFDDECLEFHQRLYAGFESEALRDPERVCMVDATRSRDEVFLEVLGSITTRYRNFFEQRG